MSNRWDEQLDEGDIDLARLLHLRVAQPKNAGGVAVEEGVLVGGVGDAAAVISRFGLVLLSRPTSGRALFLRRAE